MADVKSVEVNDEQVNDAQKMWENFMIVTKYSTIATAIILIALALAFVKLF